MFTFQSNPTETANNRCDFHFLDSNYWLTIVHFQFLLFFQSLEVIRMLKPVMPIERAQMRLKITATKEGRKLKEKLAKVCTTIETEDWDGGTVVMVGLFYF